MNASMHFGRNGQRIEFWKGNGYAHKEFRGDHGGTAGECVALVGGNMTDREMLRTCKSNLEAGTLLVCPVGIGYWK